MLWLKRNLILVVSVLVALGLSGFAGYFLFLKLGSEKEVTEQLSQQTDALKQLVERDPHPGTDKIDNIGAAKEEVKRLTKFRADLHHFYSPVARPSKLDPAQFKAVLENTIEELRREAQKVSVALPPDYAFTFPEQRKKVSFAAGSLDVLAGQLAEIRAISQVLFKARVNSLIGFRRSLVSDDRPEGGPDFLNRTITTNKVTLTVTSPYEVAFIGFTTELAAVLEGLVASPHCFIVKSVSVEPAGGTNDMSDATSPGEFRMPTTPQFRGMDPELARRYGLGPPQRGGGEGSRYGRPGMRTPVPAPVAPPTTAPPPKPASGTLVDENKLHVTLMIDAVKLTEAAKPEPAKPKPVATPN